MPATPHSDPLAPQVAVIGSSNVDLVMKMARLPEKGETVTNASYLQTFGGKGANQAVAAARAGAQTLFINAVGDDPYAKEMVANFEADGIDCSCLLHLAGVPSGHALCMIGEEGKNYLSVAPGANAMLSPERLAAALDRFRDVPVWLVQCEIPTESLRYLLEEARTEKQRVVWNFAPAIDMPEPPLAACDVLIVNEIEAQQLSGVTVLDPASVREAARALRARGVNDVIITLGAQGLYYDGTDGIHRIPGQSVEVVDTVGAGDTFCGALAAALAENRPWSEALVFAAAAAHLSVGRLGAQPSIPRREEIAAFLQAHPFSPES